ncbi:hypothetical protein E1B28_007830 [Marasmius oreades]|uniref:Uncharacterized protein n=1 Tax=Marasmius oreades TaxID=181124 RepID=A0A9P7S300_9AGAR|nr:uncharacterized protein E1B28_007830 [Marasmius oreades]KAG7094223.1 hypothetical protein E1B28_007830 [Marasmius oreades]
MVCLGATVSKIDTSFHPALSSSRLKRELIKAEQIKAYPAGLGLTGAYDLFHSDKRLSPEERYIHTFIDEDGYAFILTCFKALLELVHQVLSIECDTTFQRVQEVVFRKGMNNQEELEINEWEMVIFYKPVQRALTIMRIYTNRHDTTSYEKLFDAVQKITLDLTGQPLAFKRLRPEGNLLAMVVDMEIAQVKGAAASFAKSQDVSYSKLNGKCLPPYFIKLCHVHAKRGIHDFRLKMTKKDYRHLVNYMNHIKTKEDLERFHVFVLSFKIPALTAWWKHKRSIDWIIPCTIGGLSPMGPDWDETPNHTNAGEGQHAWSKERSFKHQKIVSAIQTGRDIDAATLKEVQMARESGVPSNTHNELVDRQTRNATRRNNRATKARTAEKQQNATAELQNELDSAQDELKLAKARRDDLKQLLRDSRMATTSSGALRKIRMPKKRKLQELSSSSGRVKIRKQTKKAKKAAKMQIQDESDDDDFELLSLSDLFCEPQNSNSFMADDLVAEKPADENLGMVQDYQPLPQPEEVADSTKFVVSGSTNTTLTAVADAETQVQDRRTKRKERDVPDVSTIIQGNAKRSRKPTSKVAEAETQTLATASMSKPVSFRRKPGSRRA